MLLYKALDLKLESVRSRKIDPGDYYVTEDEGTHISLNIFKYSTKKDKWDKPIFEGGIGLETDFKEREDGGKDFLDGDVHVGGGLDLSNSDEAFGKIPEFLGDYYRPITL